MIKLLKLSVIAMLGLSTTFTFARQEQDLSKFLPNSTLTPGVVDSSVTLEQICTKGSSKARRNVPQAVKDSVYKEYGLSTNSKQRTDKYEIDHLISLELGGSNDIKNLWPQSYTTTPWNAHVKDKLENELHRLACLKDPKYTLAQLQNEIRTNWIASYKAHLGDLPAPGK